jgi:hypothetical protein
MLSGAYSRQGMGLQPQFLMFVEDCNFISTVCKKLWSLTF